MPLDASTSGASTVSKRMAAVQIFDGSARGFWGHAASVTLALEPPRGAFVRKARDQRGRSILRWFRGTSLSIPEAASGIDAEELGATELQKRTNLH